MNSEESQPVKVGKLEIRMKHVEDNLADLSADLKQHMEDEAEDRIKLDNKMNRQTLIIVIVGVLAVGSNFPALLPFFVGLL